ncbi:ATP-dependent RNA helicase [Spathaspora sp. JA1]|nr:ATP-dependent RNA helicase [Spathaspora sp. JA1]
MLSVMIPLRQLARSLTTSARPNVVCASAAAATAVYSLRLRGLHTTPIRFNTTKIDADNLPKTASDLEGHVSSEIIESLRKNNFNTLTPIQQLSTLPLLKTERGMVCRAKTGTGKTLTFIIPTLESALARKTPGVDTLVVAPTRDLAQQIYEEYLKVIQKLPRNVTRPRVVLVTGGRSSRIDLRNPEQIVIATPGRLAADLRDRAAGDLFGSLTYRVYDEADRLLDIGFEKTLDEIHDNLMDVREDPSKPLKSLLFSATIDNSMTNFAAKHINRNFDYINTVGEDEPNVHENIHQILVQCQDTSDKYKTAISYIIDAVQESEFRGIVFLPTKTAVDWFEEYMKQISRSKSFSGDPLFGYRAQAEVLKIHGGLSVKARETALRTFKNCHKGLLVATDVVARGIDVKDVTHVFQLGPSDDPLDYVHKVGRTGRAGKTGKAIIFLTQLESSYPKTLAKVAQVSFKEIVNSNEINQHDIYKVQADYEITREFMTPNLAFLMQIHDKYRINLSDLIEENMEFMRTVTGIPNATMHISGQLKNKLKSVDRRVVSEYFGGRSNSHHGGYNDGAYSRSGGSYRDGRQGRFNNDRGNSRGGYNDRGGYNSRGGWNDRGSYSDRRGGYNGGNRDRGYDRSSKPRDDFDDIFG